MSVQSRRSAPTVGALRQQAVKLGIGLDHQRWSFTGAAEPFSQGVRMVRETAARRSFHLQWMAAMAFLGRGASLLLVRDALQTGSNCGGCNVPNEDSSGLPLSSLEKPGVSA